MSTLRLRVDKFVPGEGGPTPRVFARIQRLDSQGQAVPHTLSQVLVPISHQPQQAEDIPLTEGFYSVEVKLPSGEWLSDSVRVSDGGIQELVLAGAEPSVDWLSWQPASTVTRQPQLSQKSSHRVMADYRSEPRQVAREQSGYYSRGPVANRSSSGNQGLSVDRTEKALERVGLRRAGTGIELRRGDPAKPWEARRLAEIDVRRPLYWISATPAKLKVDVLRSDPWIALPALHGSTANIVEVLNAGRSVQIVHPAENADPNFGSAPFPVPNASGAGARGFAPTQRTFAAVHRRMGVELICLPTPWILPSTGQEVSVEVRVTHPRLEREFASAVAVRDRQLSVLLGFLSTGALPAAEQLAETAGDMLDEKNANPLAAAAGGYALVSGVADTSTQPWHQWIKNLMDRFEDVPDGAIQYGTLRLRMRTNESDLAEATAAFKAAYVRGLPFYGLGLRWLLEGLQRVGSRDAEAKKMAEAVQRLTARMHPQSPFTILRLGRQ